MKKYMNLKLFSMQQLLVVLAFLFSSMLIAQTVENNNLTTGPSIKVSVVNVSNDNGKVGFALYNEATFMKAAPLKAAESFIENGVSTIVFENIPSGEYAIVCFHDANGNDRMDFEANGMPKEDYGTSNNAMNFGPPQFENSKFVVTNEDVDLEIKF
jgi:uncharacterized protein (DUF2141 family)